MTSDIFDKLILEENEILSLINFSIKYRQKLLITYFNQHCYNIYSSDKNYKDLIENQFQVYADGIGIKLAIRFTLGKKYQRFNATDLNEKIMNRLIEEKKRFYILGGNFEESKISERFHSNKNYVGYCSGFFTENDIERIINSIKNFEPEVIIVGMGVPKQEIIAARICAMVDASLFICVGNFFEFYFGTVRRIPVRFRDKGIEWIYRLFQEPKRLWKRYLIGIPLFILRVIRFKLTLNKFG